MLLLLSLFSMHVVIKCINEIEIETSSSHIQLSRALCQLSVAPIISVCMHGYFWNAYHSLSWLLLWQEESVNFFFVDSRVVFTFYFPFFRQFFFLPELLTVSHFCILYKSLHRPTHSKQFTQWMRWCFHQVCVNSTTLIWYNALYFAQSAQNV